MIAGSNSSPKTDQGPILHSMSENGAFSGLADDEVGPLDDDDGQEERRLSRQLEILAAAVAPF